MEVERREYREQKVEAASPSPPMLSPSNPRALNDSNWMTRPSDLYSDASVLRKNNVRFGIKAKKRDDL